MKVLNRPMFRYGGPIKEGIMSGIKERVPLDKGGYLKNLAGAIANFYSPIKKAKPIQKIIQKIKPTSVPKFRKENMYDLPIGMRGPMSQRATRIPFMERAGMFTRQNPVFTGVTAPFVVSGGLAATPPIIKTGANILEAGVKQAADLLVPDFIFDQDAYFAGKKVKDAVKKDPNIGKTTKELGIAESESDKKSQVAGVEDTKPETKAERIQRYRDIMDIKGMNKAAAYDSLIAASKAVGESQDFKGDLKSGKLINQIIQSTSKAFDKPKSTKDAIDTLILKGEIEKDIKASDPANKILNQYRLKQMEKIDKDLEGTNFAENKAVQLKAGNTGQSAIDAAAAMDNEDFRGNLVTKSDLSDIIETQKKAGELDEETIVISYTNTLLAKNKDGITDGDYTVGEFLVTIKDNKVYDITR